jgi:hypothetical protein
MNPKSASIFMPIDEADTLDEVAWIQDLGTIMDMNLDNADELELYTIFEMATMIWRMRKI